MSKRVPNPRHTVTAALALLAFALLLSTFVPSIALAARPLVTIERTKDVIQGLYEYVEINFDPRGTGTVSAGFDLLIAYDDAALTLESVSQGSLLTNCSWQFFVYRSGVEAGCEGDCPTGLVRIVGLGDSPTVPGEQTCNLGDNGAGTIAVLKFFVKNNAAYECMLTPITFYWNDCADNGFASETGATYLISDTVFSATDDFSYYPIPPALNTIEGAPASCITGGSPNQPTREINYRHGYINIVCADSIDMTGDLNLNGIQYEIADAVLFSEYFLYGLSVFNEDPIFRQAQIGASDTNDDGHVLEFQDLTYLLRVIVGDALPFPKESPADTAVAIFTQNTVAKTVSASYPTQLAGGAFAFIGEIVPTFLPGAPGNFVQDYHYENGVTRVLLSSSTPHDSPDSLWFSYTGNGTLSSVQTADFFDTRITAQIVIEGAPAICGDVNEDGSINISDIVAMIGHIFDIWPGPFDPALADVDCSGTVTISDAVYLLQYVFSGGSAPCANCP